MTARCNQLSFVCAPKPSDVAHSCPGEKGDPYRLSLNRAFFTDDENSQMVVENYEICVQQGAGCACSSLENNNKSQSDYCGPQVLAAWLAVAADAAAVAATLVLWRNSAALHYSQLRRNAPTRTP